MFKKYMPVVFGCLLMLSFPSTFVFSQANPADEKIKAKVAARMTNGKRNVVVETRNGTKIKGRLTNAGGNAFTVLDLKTNQSVIVEYRDAAKVKGSGWPTSSKIAIGVGIAAAATLTVLYIAFQNAIRDN